MKKQLSGQSFVEYIILVAVVLGATVLLAEGPIKSGVDKIFSKGADAVGVIANNAN